MKCLVTGGAGFIGSNLVRRLLQEGHEVVVLDNLSTGSLKNLVGCLDDVTLSKDDIRSYSACVGVMHGVEVVFHQAALGSVPRSLKDPVSTHENNVSGTLNILEAARESGVRRVVFASSSSVYGDVVRDGVKHENMALNPISPYAASKCAGEMYCRAYTKAFELETIALRYFNVYGPRQNPMGDYAAVIPKFIRAALTKTPLTIYGSGNQRRDFTYVEDVCTANILAATYGIHGMAYNIGTGQTTSVNELAQAVWSDISSYPIDKTHVGARSGDVQNSQADTNFARLSIGFRAVVPLADGLNRTVSWFAGTTI